MMVLDHLSQNWYVYLFAGILLAFGVFLWAASIDTEGTP